jgi:hypothetical protein
MGEGKKVASFQAPGRGCVRRLGRVGSNAEMLVM